MSLPPAPSSRPAAPRPEAAAPAGDEAPSRGPIRLVAGANGEGPAPTRAASTVVVTIYTTSWCGVCRRAKAWMSARGVSYVEKDVEASAAYASEWRALGTNNAVPTTVVDRTVLVGFSESRFQDALDAAARRRDGGG